MTEVLNFSSPKDARDHGFALFTEEKKSQWYCVLKGQDDITFNTTLRIWKHFRAESLYSQ